MSFHEYRRRLPHWRDDNATYFVTWRVRTGLPELEPAERSLVLKALTHFAGQRYDLLAAVVMNDHVHVICRSFEGFVLQHIVHSWKSYTAKIIVKGRGSSGSIWQDEYFDRIIRDEKELIEKLTYIQNNPLNRWQKLRSMHGSGFLAIEEIGGRDAHPTIRQGSCSALGFGGAGVSPAIELSNGYRFRAAAITSCSSL